MLIQLNSNKLKNSYNKIKISNLFSNNKFIIYINLNYNFKKCLLIYKNISI